MPSDPDDELSRFQSLCLALRQAERAFRSNATPTAKRERDRLLEEALNTFATVDRRDAEYVKEAALTGQTALIDMLHNKRRHFYFRKEEWDAFLELSSPEGLIKARRFGLLTGDCFITLMSLCARDPSWLPTIDNKGFLGAFMWKREHSEFQEALRLAPEIVGPLARLMRHAMQTNPSKAAIHARASLQNGTELIANAYFLAGLRIPPEMGHLKAPNAELANSWIAKQATHHGQMAIQAIIGTDLEDYLRSLALEPNDSTHRPTA